MPAKPRPSVQRIRAGKGHWYKVDGVKASGVTTIIKDALPPNLAAWSARTVATYVAEHRDQVRDMMATMPDEMLVDALKGVPWSTVSGPAAKRGNDVHNFLVPLFAGEEVHPPDDLRGFVSAAARFMDDWDLDPILSETVCASRTYGHAGSLDAVARVNSLPGRPVAIIDYKSGNRIYGETALQTNAYGHSEVYVDADGVEHDMSELGIEIAMAVHVQDGDYGVYWLPYSDAVYADFLLCMKVGAMKERVKAAKRGPLREPKEW